MGGARSATFFKLRIANLLELEEMFGLVIVMMSVFKPASCSYQTWICASHRLNLGIGRPLISSSITWEALASQPAGGH